MKGDFVVERETPTVSGWQTVFVVLVLALGSGLVVFAGSGLLCLAFHWSVTVAYACAGLGILVVWVTGILKLEGLFWVSETVRTVTNAPRAVSETLQVEVSEPDRGRLQFLDLPGTADQLETLARGLVAGRTFAQESWTGSGRLYSRSQFIELRDQLLDRGLLSWRNPRAPSQGLELTTVGRHVFARLAENAHTHRQADTGGQFALLDEGQQGGGHVEEG